MALIDFHCHLDLYQDPQKVAQEAAKRGVYVLSVTTTPTAFTGTAALAPEGSRIRTALGLHPELAAEREHELVLFEKLLSCTRYIGEVGLDGSRSHKATLDRQSGILTEILSLAARAGGKIISLHSRGAASLLLDVLSVEPRAGKFVLHWYSGTPRQVQRATELQCWFSVSTSMAASERGRSAIAAMPRNRVIPETDGPFGAVDGRPAFPWEANLVVPRLAEIWNETPEQVSQRMTSNFQSLVT